MSDLIDSVCTVKECSVRERALKGCSSSSSGGGGGIGGAAATPTATSAATSKRPERLAKVG